MLSFNIQSGNFPQQRQQTVEGMRQTAQNIANQGMAPLTFALQRSADLEAAVKAARAQLDAVTSAKDAAAAQLEEAKKIVGDIRPLAAKTGVDKYATNFQEAGTKHADAAKRWLTAAGVFIGLTIALAFVLLKCFPLPDNATFASAVTFQRLVARIAPLFFSAYILFWCVRNYRSHKHLQVVNEHRQHALRTFETFADATDDTGTRNAVLLEATRCVFAPATTGYLSGEDDPNPSRIIEILKTVSGRPGS